MRPARLLVALALAGAASPALAGPPYLTDDPVPTETGHWEIYAFTAGEGRGSVFDGDAGVDLNYGPVKDVQLTSTLPLSFTHDRNSGWRVGTGDVELGVKYRFLDDEKNGFAAAVFPRLILRPRPSRTVRRRGSCSPYGCRRISARRACSAAAATRSIRAPATATSGRARSP